MTEEKLSTGIRKLDKILGGGLQKGLTVITGPEGSGKSTFCTQIISKALTNTEYGILILTQSEKDTMARLKAAGAEFTIDRKDEVGFATVGKEKTE